MLLLKVASWSLQSASGAHPTSIEDGKGLQHLTANLHRQHLQQLMHAI